MKNHVQRHNHVKGAVREWYRLIQVSFAKPHEPVYAERNSTGTSRSDCCSAHVNATTLTPDMTYNEGQRAARSTTEIEETACARELDSGNVFLKFVCGQPRVLADVFPVGFAPELVPQGRIKLFIKIVIVPAPRFHRNGHVPSSIHSGSAGRSHRHRGFACRSLNFQSPHEKGSQQVAASNEPETRQKVSSPRVQIGDDVRPQKTASMPDGVD